MDNSEEIKGLPDVDLGPVIRDIEKTASIKESHEAPPKEGETKVQDLGQFKTPEEVLKGYKEVQAFATKVSQENKLLKEQQQALAEQLELAKLSAQQQYIQPQLYAPPPQVNQYGQPIDEPLEAKIDRTVAIREIAGVLEDEADKNRNEFQERYAYAQYVSRDYPQLARTPRGVRKLFELGDKLRAENMKRNAGKALESIFGEPLGQEEINKLRTLVKGDKAITQQNFQTTNAYMPETSTSTKSGSDQNRIPNIELELKESVQKGDVDGTIAALLKKQLAE